MSHDFIIDAEVVGIDPKTKKNLPFQLISQRIKRKHGIKEMISKLPVVINVFDMTNLDSNTIDILYVLDLHPIVNIHNLV